MADRAAAEGDQVRVAVEVMDRLRSPGGCPWDAEQTHRSLAPYLLEETYEVLEAIDTGDDAALREELGDLLLQVLFHARIASESSLQPWGIDDVAAELVAKLTRRHPHVFAGVEVSGAEEVNANWERIKAVEKQRGSILDGVALAQPALALAAKLVDRAARAGVHPTVIAETESADGFGAELFGVVQRAVGAGIDPEQALRVTTLRYRAALATAERDRPA